MSTASSTDPSAESGGDKAARLRKLVESSVERLADALDAGHSESFKALLDATSRFHRYSFQNLLLILTQRPDATRVAGFHTWKSLGRCVRKGEKGIAIFAPMMVRARSKDRDDEADGNAERVLRFRVVHVFDLAQTDGDPLPEPERVGGDARTVLPMLEQLVTGLGIALTESDALGSADGVSCGGSIKLRPGLEPAERFSVLVHELAHEMLHRVEGDQRPSKAVRETEAEAVAYVVGEAVGLSTSTAAADYILHHRGDRKLLAASLDRIQKTACTIIDAVLPDQRGAQFHQQKVR